MSSKVYFIKAQDNDDDAVLCGKLRELIIAKNLLGFIEDRDTTAVKTHFGEVAGAGLRAPCIC